LLWSCGESNPGLASGFLFFYVRSPPVPFSTLASAAGGVSSWSTHPSSRRRGGCGPRRHDPLTDACTAGGVIPGSVRDGPHCEADAAHAARARSDCLMLAVVGCAVCLQGHRAILGTLHHEAI